MLSLIILVVIVALVFDYINGFHDTANAIATSVSTRVLSPSQAIIMAASLNFAGALFSTKVAKTIGKGIIDINFVTQELVLAALLGAIVWNLITWYYGIPSSSSHALIGGIIGAGIIAGGFSILNYEGIIEKIIVPLITSPIVGMAFGFIIMISLLWLVRRWSPKSVNKYFSKFQIVSAAFMAFSHGNNDAQKSMGIITMALVSGGFIDKFDVPIWVVLACASAMALGTAAGGWRIIKTMGHKIIKLEPIHGFAAETAAALTIQVASFIGAPVSTTHVISSSIIGVGSAKRLSAVRWGVAHNMIIAWILTIPCSALIAALCYKLLSFMF